MSRESLKSSVNAYDVWISPEGEFFQGNGHNYQAELIAETLYGLHEDDLKYDAAEYLISRGWVKATRGVMWMIYQQRPTTWRMTQATYDALFEFCEYNEWHKLLMPKDIQIISSERAQLGDIYGPDNRDW